MLFSECMDVQPYTDYLHMINDLLSTYNWTCEFIFQLNAAILRDIDEVVWFMTINNYAIVSSHVWFCKPDECSICSCWQIRHSA